MTRRLTMMNLVIRGIDGDLGPRACRHVSPQDLKAYDVLANGSICSNQSDEGEICNAIIDANLVALPG